MKTQHGCFEGTVNLQAYFQHNLRHEKWNREMATNHTRQLARVANDWSLNQWCAYLHCKECPKYLFFKHLEQLNVYTHNEVEE